MASSRALLLVLTLLAAPAAGAPTREPSLAERYVRLSAANAAGDFATARTEIAALLARDPANPDLAIRAYRQAIASGDRPLATRMARQLDQKGVLPVDGPLLLAIDAVEARDWRAARAAVDRFDQGRLFAFLTPLLRAWIAVGARDLDPLVVLEPARTAGIAQGYFAEQHALLLIATGKVAEGAGEVRALPQPGTRLKIVAAAALARSGDRTAAAAMLTGDEQPLAAARARLAAGRRLELGVDDAADGIGELLSHVAADFDRQRLVPLSTVLARFATFAAPRNSSAWIATAQVLGIAHQPDAALAALDHVPPGDPFAGAAQTIRIAILLDSGDREKALDAARAATRLSDAGADEWRRLGDVLLTLDRNADAAESYRRAIAALGATPARDAWQLWLQQGSALEEAGDWPGAKAALEQAYALAPDQPVVLNHLGYSKLARREDVTSAQALIAKANQLRPDDPAITDSLGWSRFLMGRPADAAPLLERAVAGDPGEPTINEHLGDVYWALGRRIEARYAWRAALVTAEAKDATRLNAKVDLGLTPETTSP